MASPIIFPHCFFFLSLPLSLIHSHSLFLCLPWLVSKVTCQRTECLQRTGVKPPPFFPNLPCQTNFAVLTLGHVTTPVPMTTRLRAVDECISLGNNEQGLKPSKKIIIKWGRGKKTGVSLTCRSQKPFYCLSAAPNQPGWISGGHLN